MITEIIWRKLKKIGNTNIRNIDSIFFVSIVSGMILLLIILGGQDLSTITPTIADNCYNCKEVQGEVLETEEIVQIGNFSSPGYRITIVKLDTGTITFSGISHYFPKKEIICIRYRTKQIGISGNYHNVIENITLGRCSSYSSRTQKLKE